MDLIITVIHIITAIILPISAIVMIVLTLIRVFDSRGKAPTEKQACVRCNQSRSGGEAVFHYAEAVGNARERAAKKQLVPSDTPILGSETHFVCDSCAKRFIRNETIQILLMALPYPLYLYVIIPVFAENGIFANFLIETLLIVLSIAGTTAAFDMFRAARVGEMPLSEARDRVAIQQRRPSLGKKFSYYTRIGHSHLGK
jgi:hypothetical protein